MRDFYQLASKAVHRPSGLHALLAVVPAPLSLVLRVPTVAGIHREGCDELPPEPGSKSGERRLRGQDTHALVTRLVTGFPGFELVFHEFFSGFFTCFSWGFHCFSRFFFHVFHVFSMDAGVQGAARLVWACVRVRPLRAADWLTRFGFLRLFANWIQHSSDHAHAHFGARDVTHSWIKFKDLRVMK